MATAAPGALLLAALGSLPAGARGLLAGGGGGAAWREAGGGGSAVANPPDNDDWRSNVAWTKAPCKDADRVMSPPYYAHCEFDTLPARRIWENLYEITEEDFRETFMDSSSDKLGPVLQRWAAGQKGHIVVMGGSMTCGAGCIQGHLLWKHCSWPARFASWARAKFPDAGIELRNAAIPGTPMLPQLGKLGILLAGHEKPDVIIVDTILNDVNSDPEWEARYFEQLILAVRASSPDTVVMSLFAHANGACGPLCEKSQPKTKEAQRRVLKHYGLPVVDFGALVMKRHLEAMTHPSWRNHQYIADVLAYVFGAALDASGNARPSSGAWPTPLWPGNTDPDAWRTCEKPVTVYSAEEPGAARPLVLAGNWTLYEDRPHKPGWIGEGWNSSIRFPVQFGEHPRLLITYLQSYENLGSAEVVVHRHPQVSKAMARTRKQKAKSWILKGIGFIYGAPVSQTGLIFVSNAGKALQFPSFAKAHVDFRLVHGEDPKVEAPKFKILDVISC